MKEITLGVAGVNQQLELTTRPEASLKWFVHNGWWDEAARYLDTEGNWHTHMTFDRHRGGTYFDTEEEAQTIFQKYLGQSLPPTLKPVGE